METGFFSRRRLEKARLAPIFALAAFAFLGAARMEAGLQEEAIVREEGTFGFSELAARAEGTAETIQEKDGRVSVQLKDVKAAVRKTDPGRENKRDNKRENKKERECRRAGRMERVRVRPPAGLSASGGDRERRAASRNEAFVHGRTGNLRTGQKRGRV